MAPVISACTQVSVHGTNLTGRPWAIVQHWVLGGSGDTSPLDGSTAWVQAFINQIMPVLSVSVAVTGGTYVDLRTSSGTSGPTAPIGPPVQGGGSGTMCPPNTAILVKNSTNGARNARSGRMYLPGVDEDQVDATGALTSGYLDDIQEAVEGFWDELTSSAIIPVVNSKTAAGGYAPVTITGMATQGLVATQRRRLRR